MLGELFDNAVRAELPDNNLWLLSQKCHYRYSAREVNMM